MTGHKRFALHDPCWSAHGLSCRRCPASSSLRSSEPAALWRALQQLERQPCARAVLDARGYPVPA